MHKNRYNLLSIDGGGIRGILPICALAKLEESTGKLTRDIVSFAAGTSTGAIIAAAIAAGIPAKKMLELYTRRAKEVFTQSPFNGIKRFLKGYMYETATLYELIREEMSGAKDWTLNDSPIDILLTAKRVTDGMPVYLVKDNNHNSCNCGNLQLADCVTASAAAPTYFYPWNLTNSNGKTSVYVDGGVGIAGNPVYQACIEAFYYTDTYTPENTTVISLGTGRFTQLSQPSHLLSWLEWILKELLTSPGEQQTEIVQRHFPETKFYRLDPDLKEIDPTLNKEIPLDDIGAIDRLVEYGFKFAEMIDWKAILEGKDEKFSVTDRKTLWYQYKQP